MHNHNGGDSGGNGCVPYLAGLAAILVAVFAFAAFPHMQWLAGEMAHDLAWAWEWLLVGILFFGALFAATIIALVILRRVAIWQDAQVDRRRYKDGFAPLQERTFKVLDPQTGSWITGTVIHDPNRALGASTAITSDGQVYDLTPVGKEQHALALAEINGRVRIAGAVSPGDDALGNLRVPYRPNLGGAFRLASAPAPRPAWRPDDVPPPAQLPAPPPRLLTFEQAITLRDNGGWVAGQNGQSGKLAKFHLIGDVHAGIVGRSGSGKTNGVGATLIAAALNNERTHGEPVGVTIWDGKGGLDWGKWKHLVEWQPVSGRNLFDAVQVIYNDFAARTALLQQHGASTIDDLPRWLNVRHHLHAVEEFGSAFAWLKQQDKQAAKDADLMLADLFNLGRAAGVHMLLIDQYPGKWSEAAKAGAGTWLAVHQLGPNQGVGAGDWHAQEIEGVGVFRLGREEYRSWDSAPHRETLLRTLPPSRAPRLIEGEWTVLDPPPARSAGAFGSNASNAGIERGWTVATGETERAERAERAEREGGVPASTLPGADDLTPAERSAPVKEFLVAVAKMLHREGHVVDQALMREYAASIGRAVSRERAYTAYHEWRAGMAGDD